MRDLDEVINDLWKRELKRKQMPKIERQQPPRTQPTLPPGSVLSTAVPVSSLVEIWIKLCIYGRNRSGKTSLAAEVAKALKKVTGKPALFISAEPDACGGATSISNVEGISLIRVSAKKLPGDRIHGSAKVVAIANELAENNPFSLVVLDTVTSLQDVIHCELMGLPKVPEVMSWGTVPDGVYQQRAEKLRETIRPLLDLTNCTIIILAQEKDHNASEDRKTSIRSKLINSMQQGSFMAPSLGSTNAQWLSDNCGYVVQIYEDEVMEDMEVPVNNPDGTPGEPMITKVGTGKRQRHLRLLYHPNFAAGGRWQWDRNVPEFVTAPTPRELYLAMARYIPSLKG